MVLYDTQRSGNAWKVRLMAGLLGIKLTRRTLSIDSGDLRGAPWREIAPLGQVPLLALDDGTYLAESFAILFYMAQGSAYWPMGLVERANVMSWLSFEQDRHMKPLAKLRLHFSLRKDRAGLETSMRRAGFEGRKALDLLEEQLKRQGGWVSTVQHPSIADIALYPYTRLAPMGGIELSGYPCISGWLARIEALPGYEPLFPERPDLTFSTSEQPV
jgi:glutathione S-transferase